MLSVESPTVHIRFDGRSYDFDGSDLDIGFGSDDVTVKRAVVNYLNEIQEQQVPFSKLNNYVVNRNEAENSITIRPDASFG